MHISKTEKYEQGFGYELSIEYQLDFID